jgi:hypothetical protein
MHQSCSRQRPMRQSVRMPALPGLAVEGALAV